MEILEAFLCKRRGASHDQWYAHGKPPAGWVMGTGVRQVPYRKA